MPNIHAHAPTSPPKIMVQPRSSCIRWMRAPAGAAAARYDRAWDLPRLTGLWPADVADVSLEGRERVVARLRQALRAERQRGVSGHWTYDLTRHNQLLIAFRHELDALLAARRRQRAAP